MSGPEQRPLREIADAVLAHVDGNWQVASVDECNIFYADGEGGRLYFQRFTREWRVTVTALSPWLDGYRCFGDWGVLPYDTEPPRATFAPDRDPHALAREITRKVLEPYKPLLAAVLQRRGEIIAAWAGADALGDEIAQLIGAEPFGTPERGKPRLFLCDDRPFGQAAFEVQSERSVRIELRSLDRNRALELVRWLAERREAEGDGQ